MNSLIGTYECKADAKGRILLPAPLKKQLATVTPDGFVLKRAVFQPCLELYPMAEWESMMQNVNKLNRFRKKNNDFIILLDIDRVFSSEELAMVQGSHEPKEEALSAQAG